MNNLQPIISSLCFFLLLALPGLQWATQALPDTPLEENRTAFPVPVWSENSLKGYLLGWQSWFNDQYPTRNLFIRLNTQINYSVFSYSDKVYIGSNGWMFYRSVIDVEKAAIEKLSLENADQIIENFKKLNIWLRSRGVILLVMDNRLKDAIYPEELPHSVPSNRSDSFYQNLRKRIATETGATYLDASVLLQKLKLKRSVFHKTDFHWNDPAAFAVSEALVNKAALITGHPTPGWRWPLKIKEGKFFGGQAAFMPLLNPVSEKGLFLEKTWPAPPSNYKENDGPFEFSIAYTDDDRLRLPGIVVFGDSFFDGMIRSGFLEHFNSVHRARLFHSSIDQVLRELPAGTRFFLYQFIETYTPSLTLPLDLPEGSAE
jgi:hypothetical protein